MSSLCENSSSCILMIMHFSECMLHFNTIYIKKKKLVRTCFGSISTFQTREKNLWTRIEKQMF